MTCKKHWTTFAAALLSAAALVLCIIMAAHSLTGSRLIGCSAGSACDSVLSGKWSTLLGIFPVSGLAAGVYIAMLLCLGVRIFSSDDELQRIAAAATALLCGAIAGAAVWFIGLQIFAEGALCKYCMTAHGLGLIVCALLLPGLLRDGSVHLAIGPEWVRRHLRPAPLFVVGLLLAAAMAVLQVLTAPDYVYQDGTVGEPLPLIGSDEAPVIGDPQAEYVVDLLFDYQCSHCQKLHQILPEVVERFEGRVAFVLCPCPLSAKCNPYIPPDQVGFEGSCELARYALALYSIDPALYSQYDAWLFEPDPKKGWYPRPVQEARERAEALVGTEALYEAISGDFVTMRLSRTAELFGRTSVGGQGGIPRFIYGDSWLVPEADSAADIAQILSERLNLR